MTESTLIIFGATGDLTKRLLLPALGQLLDREPERQVHLIGVGRSPRTDDQWRAEVRDAFGSDAGPTATQLAAETSYSEGDLTTSADLSRLLDSATGRPVLYFAVPPAVAENACEALREVDIPAGTILALEKPFGTDESSAHALNELLTELVPESQVFRVDHFLGQSVLLDILSVRFANRIFEPVWSGEHVESVEIRYDEDLGLEGRANFYEGEGALRDMVQSHLLQLLAVVAMDPPATLGERDLRDATGAVLRAVRVAGDDVIASSHRARYTAGEVNGKPLPSYVDEDGVDEARHTETLAQVTFDVHTTRWEGVPFTLRSGKALAPATKEIALTFRPLRHLAPQFGDAVAPNVLRLQLRPDTISVQLNVHDGTDPFALQTIDFATELGSGSVRAYAEVLSGILDADPTLAVRGDAAEECWRIVQPVIDAWRADEVPLDEYPAGSSGPADWP